MKIAFILFFAALLLPWVTFQASAKQPNIIVIMGDDHGQWATGAYGDSPVETPTLDWMAKKGVMFSNAMTPSPVCSPARASFFTGKMPSQHGVHDFLSESTDYEGNWLQGQTLLSERLQKKGYKTALIGKWHATRDSRVPQPGFDKWISFDAFKEGWRNQYEHSGAVHFSVDGEPLTYSGIQASFLSAEAVKFIDEADEQPFFISLNLVEPHAPFEGLPERLVDRYRHIADDYVKAGDSSDLKGRGGNMGVPNDHAEKLAQYLAAVTLIDEQVARIYDALYGRDLIKDTIIIYTADHGLQMGQYGLYGKTNSTFQQNFYEDNLRIPLIFYGPNWLRNAQTRFELVSLIDLHTTILDFASAGENDTNSETNKGPGRSLKGMLKGERETKGFDLHFAERGNARMVTDARWKLVRYYEKNSEFKDLWYDLVHPLGERVQTFGPSEPVKNKLSSALEQFFSKYETPEFSGRNVWQQPPPNRRVCKDLGIQCP